MTSTLGEMFSESASKHLNNPALGIISADNKVVNQSYHSVLCQAEALAGSLLESGVSKGDRVAIISKSSPYWAKVDLANQLIGAVTVSLYPNANQEELSAILNDSGAKILFYEDSLSEKIGKLSTTFLERKVGFSEIPSFLKIGYKTPVQVESSDLSTLCYTSGTTGEPKGVMLSHANIMHNLQALDKVNPFKSTDVHLSFLPLSHIFERTVGHYYPIFCGANIVYSRGLESLKDDLTIVKPTIFIGVPKVFERIYSKVMETAESSKRFKKKLFNSALDFGKLYSELIKEEKRISAPMILEHIFFDKLVYSKIRQIFGGRLRMAITGSAPISKEVINFYDSIGITLLEGYGLTETAPIIAANTLKDRRVGSVGKIFPDVDVKLNPVDGHDVDGEILVKGPNVTSGYWNKPEKTKEVMKEDWFCTGDLGRLDKDGFLYITGRIKDEFKLNNGKFVAGGNLEKYINKIPQVMQSVVFPSANKEYVVALIVPNNANSSINENHGQVGGIDKLGRIPSSSATPQFVNNSDSKDLEQKIKEEIDVQCAGFAHYERIKNFALVNEPFTEQNGLATPTQKIKRSAVAKKYADIIAKL